MLPSGHARTLLLLVAAVCATAQTTASLVDAFLKEPVFYKQIEIGKQIVARGDPSVIPQFQPLLEDPDRHVRGNAAFVIASLGDRTGFDAIVAILSDRSPDRKVGPPVAYVGPKSQRPKYRSLESQIQEDRYYAVHLLGDLKDRAGIPVLLNVAKDPALDYAVPWALGQIGGPNAIQALIAGLINPNPEVRAFSSQALGDLRATEALPRLTLLLKDETPLHMGKIPTVAEYARLAIAAIQR